MNEMSNLMSDWAKTLASLDPTKASGELRAEMKRLADIFGGHVLDVTDATYTIELTGTGSKLDNFLRAIDKETILEVVRSGATGIALGQKALHA